ncbi:MAG: zf-HC2 domain-containing protein [Eubacteriales bacterium]|nr:zf-HC2 domain-containing protein [Eubacteriales bacterium]
MRENCNIIRDLFPSYVDGLCSSDSKKCIEEHVKACPECREILDAMQETWATEEIGEKHGTDAAGLTVDEQKIIEEVNMKFKRDLRKKRIQYGCVVLLIVLLFGAMVLPIKNIPKDKIFFYYMTFKIGDHLDGTPMAWSEISHDENDVCYMNDDVDIDQATFYKFENPVYAKYNIYMEENWLKSHEYLAFAEVDSVYPIKKYTYHIEEVDGSNEVVFDKVKTSWYEKNNNISHVESFLIPEKIGYCSDEIE